jgi:hypothetical protein
MLILTPYIFVLHHHHWILQYGRIIAAVRDMVMVIPTCAHHGPSSHLRVVGAPHSRALHDVLHPCTHQSGACPMGPHCSRPIHCVEALVLARWGCEHLLWKISSQGLNKGGWSWSGRLGELGWRGRILMLLHRFENVLAKKTLDLYTLSLLSQELAKSLQRAYILWFDKHRVLHSRIQGLELCLLWYGLHEHARPHGR